MILIQFFLLEKTHAKVRLGYRWGEASWAKRLILAGIG